MNLLIRQEEDERVSESHPIVAVDEGRFRATWARYAAEMTPPSTHPNPDFLPHLSKAHRFPLLHEIFS
jgi:hypothetical protein